jgi:hypothetical protein
LASIPDTSSALTVEAQVQILLRRLDRAALRRWDRYAAKQAHERASAIADRLARRVRELTDRWTG